MHDENVKKLFKKGLDYIMYGVEEMSSFTTPDRNTPQPILEANEKHLDKSITYLHCGLEKILKAKLADYHFAFIFSDIKSADQTKFAEGRLSSVSPKDSVDRLNRWYSIINENETNLIRQFSEIRNNLEHWFIEWNWILQKDTQKIIFKILSFIIKFINKPETFDIQAHEDQFDFLGEIVSKTKLITGYRDFRRNEIKNDILNSNVNGDYFISCPCCKEDTLTLVKNTLITNTKQIKTSLCLFCGCQLDEGGWLESEYIKKLSSKIETKWKCTYSNDDCSDGRLIALPDREYFCLQCFKIDTKKKLKKTT
ncbi:hypothetical protein [Bacillus mobilis]|uniref:hypothetical protein n=1 Tax=Bacillus mobilis TaxID=2026190 RepID=UPI002E21B991|nr:hypothetical protein [Bacillus mobilis]MED0955552.1 hypothetical protein [Bacillus mobilis]